MLIGDHRCLYLIEALPLISLDVNCNLEMRKRRGNTALILFLFMQWIINCFVPFNNLLMRFVNVVGLIFFSSTFCCLMSQFECEKKSYYLYLYFQN